MEAKSASVPAELRERRWYTGKDVYAFLVDAPITFGHSQLVITVNSTAEEEKFESAARHIANCIRILRTTLCSLDLKQWDALARDTRTSGGYTKTLVLKASANESISFFMKR